MNPYEKSLTMWLEKFHAAYVYLCNSSKGGREKEEVMRNKVFEGEANMARDAILSHIRG